MCNFCLLNLGCKKSCLLLTEAINAMVDSKAKNDREQIATCSKLTSIQIDKLYRDSERTVTDKVIIVHREAKVLTLEEMNRIFNTNDDDNIALLVKRYCRDETFEERVLADKYLKFKILQYSI